MSVRVSISKELMKSFDFLKDWVCDEDANIRRFAIELMRPQGVWAKHIAELKEDPAKALSLLEAVRSDPVKYDQDSVREEFAPEQEMQSLQHNKLTIKRSLDR